MNSNLRKDFFIFLFYIDNTMYNAACVVLVRIQNVCVNYVPGLGIFIVAFDRLRPTINFELIPPDVSAACLTAFPHAADHSQISRHFPTTRPDLDAINI